MLHDKAVNSEHGIPLGEWLKYFGDSSFIDSPLVEEGIE